MRGGTWGALIVGDEMDVANTCTDFAKFEEVLMSWNIDSGLR